MNTRDINKKKFAMEMWYMVDISLFKDDPKVLMKEDQYNDYITTKTAFILNLYEMYLVSDYDRHFPKWENKKDLFKHIFEMADTAKLKSESHFQEKSTIQCIKEDAEDMGYHPKENPDINIIKHIMFKYNRSCVLDEMFLVDFIKGTKTEILENWKYKLLYNSHKVFRNYLVEHSLEVANV